MKFSIGDKVKFMDQQGEGLITKIMGPSTVGVTVDGFELPYATGDLIKVEKPSSSAERLFYEGKAVYGNPEPKEEDRRKAAAPKAEKEPVPKTLADYGLEDIVPSSARNTEPTDSDKAAEDETDLRIAPLQRGFVSKKPQQEGVYIGLLPVDQQFMLRGDIEFHIINFTPHTLLYSLATKGAESFYGVDFASVPPYSRILVESIDREDLGLWTEGILQGLFCMDENTLWLKPFSQTFKIRAAQVSQAENYVHPVFMRDKVLLVPLLDLTVHAAENGIAFQERGGKPSAGNGSLANAAGQMQAPQNANPLARYMIAKDTAEVDLHIEKLMETRLECRNIEEREYLSKQLSVFETCLNQAVGQKLAKIIFIHGVGEGTLKHEIEKRLKQYPDVHFMDASVSRYGRGAIEVYLKF